MKPFAWKQSAEAAPFWSRLGAASRSVLMLDYDGTLAPFKDDPFEAYPYPGVEHRLAILARLPNVRLVLVSGRAAQVLAGLIHSLPGRPPAAQVDFEIWGDHGRERLNADRSYRLRPLSEPDRETIEQVSAEITRLGFSHALEAKPASLAVHWRGFDPAIQARIRSLVEQLHARCARSGTLQLLAFDGGVELRSDDYNKGSAVEQILAEETPGVPAAYLGDDLTDEDAFAALGERGLSILVRREPRASAARFWLQPPEELLQFLDEWIQASSGNAPKNTQKNTPGIASRRKQ